MLIARVCCLQEAALSSKGVFPMAYREMAPKAPWWSQNRALAGFRDRIADMVAGKPKPEPPGKRHTPLAESDISDICVSSSGQADRLEHQWREDCVGRG